MKKKLLFIFSLMLIAVSTWAAKAHPEPATITQSDGTKLTVLAYGDEDFHWYTTTDGVLLSHVGYDYFVAAIDEQGDLSPTHQLAHEKAQRSLQETAIIAMQAHRLAAFNSRKNEEIQNIAAARKIPVGTPSTPYFPHTGTPKAMVILVQFPDLSFSVSDPVRSFNDYLNGEGSLPNYGLREDRNYGSVAQYFTDMSQGMFTPQFDIFGPVTLQNSWTYYGKNSGGGDMHSHDLVKEACQAIADTVDFSAYDSDGDRLVDFVCIIYAGYGENISGNSSDCIWPKSGIMYGVTYDGISVSRFSIINELNYSPSHSFKEEPYKRINGIGLFCQEFSHTLGLPAMYPTTASAMAVDNQTMEYWDLMDSGQYTDNGYTPTPYTPWEREVMGWTQIEELSDAAQLVIDEGKFYKISSEDNSEQVILQNIQNTGWYSKMPDHGLIVYHVDYTDDNGQPLTSVNSGDCPNNTAGKPGMTIIPADGLLINYFRIYAKEEDKSNATPYSYQEWQYSHMEDLYPGDSNVSEILQFKLNRSTLEKPLYNITEKDNLITLDYLKDPAAPTTYTLSITASGNGSVTYNGTATRNQTRTYSMNEGTSAMLTFSADSGHKLSSVKVNGTEMTGSVTDNHYTISDIRANTNVVVAFEELELDGIKVNATNFPDENFRTWILENVNEASDGMLTTEEIKRIKNIDCHGNSIKSLQGIEFFTALTYLNCSVNSELTTLDVSKNRDLIQLYCYSNQLTSLDISKNTALTTLWCPTNQLKSLDVSKNTALTTLWCYHNQLTSLDVSYNTSLTELDCDKQYVTLSVIKLNEGLAVPVSDDFDLSRVSDLTLNLKGVSGKVVTNGGKKYLVFIDANTSKSSDDVTLLMYNYNTGGSMNITMNVRISLLYSPATYTLSITSSGNGSVTYYNNSTIRNQTRSFTVNEGANAYLSFIPDTGYKVASVKVNNTDVTASVSNNQYTISNIQANTTVSVTFEAIPSTTYTLSITASGNGNVTYNNTSIRNQTRSFSVNKGTNATLTFSPDSGYKIASVKVNNVDVTSSVSNYQYTISNIQANTTVTVTFEEEIRSMTLDGVNYTVTSNSVENRTVNVARGNYGQYLFVPGIFTYNGNMWHVTGLDSDAFDDCDDELAAVIWYPDCKFTATITNPNFLLYVTAQKYAPSGLKNVVVNGTASEITLTDGADGNNFYCPRDFLAYKISYSHSYGMTTGINECQGWETIALPFDVQDISHRSKGTLVPFSKWSGTSWGTPFWLYRLGSNGFEEADGIAANTPYIISMPNNPKYHTEYNVSGEVTFSTSILTTVKCSDKLETSTYGNRTFTPNFTDRAASNSYYVLNAVNAFAENNSSYADGSTFVRNLRAIRPFEAFLTVSGNNAKAAIPIFENAATRIRGVEELMEASRRCYIYNLNGQIVSINGRTEGLRAGIYIVNGRKVVIK